jgi:hypothetical protein
VRAKTLTISTLSAEIILPAELGTAKRCQVETTANEDGREPCGSTGLMAANALLDNPIWCVDH